MPSRKIRAFLDTNVLLAYLGGKVELQPLFSEDVRRRAAFAVNAIVLQELLLARGRAEDGVDLTQVVPYLEVIEGDVDLSSPAFAAQLQQLRNRLMHTNDVLILAGARSCDVLLTYDRDLLEMGPAAAIRSETPEEFLEELGIAA